MHKLNYMPKKKARHHTCYFHLENAEGSASVMMTSTSCFTSPVSPQQYGCSRRHTYLLYLVWSHLSSTAAYAVILALLGLVSPQQYGCIRRHTCFTSSSFETGRTAPRPGEISRDILYDTIRYHTYTSNGTISVISPSAAPAVHVLMMYVQWHHLTLSRSCCTPVNDVRPMTPSHPQPLLLYTFSWWQHLTLSSSSCMCTS